MATWRKRLLLSTAQFYEDLLSLGAFFWRIQKRICDRRSNGFFATIETEDPKEDRLP